MKTRTFSAHASSFTTGASNIPRILSRNFFQELDLGNTFLIAVELRPQIYHRQSTPNPSVNFLRATESNHNQHDRNARQNLRHCSKHQRPDKANLARHTHDHDRHWNITRQNIRSELPTFVLIPVNNFDLTPHARALCLSMLSQIEYKRLKT